MKALLLVFFISFAGICSAQVVPASVSPGDDTAFIPYDSIPFHYPYYGRRVPPFMGVVIGYEGIVSNVICWEAGVIFHVPQYISDWSSGPIIGGALTYKQSFSTRLKTIEAELGIYTPFSIGVGFNQNFYEGTRTFGFRPFLGTSWYHFQLLAGYNFYSKKQTFIGEMDQFTLKVRYAIPVTRMFKDQFPNAGNN